MGTDIKDLLLVSFGGPTPGCCKKFNPCPGEAYCFVSGIFGDNPARKARIDEVTEHYRALGGYSKFDALTQAQGVALKAELARRGISMTVRSGYHHWAPYVRDKVSEMKAAGVTDFLALILAPHQSSVSWDGYIRIVSEAVTDAGDNAPRLAGIAKPFWNKPGFIDALADNIRKAAASAGKDTQDNDVGVVFSAHAVPNPLARTSPYCAQVEETAALTARALGISDYVIGYQSQPRDSKIGWTQPALEDAVAQLAKRGKRSIIGAPVGFLCDNVEVLYDLGIEGEREARRHGAAFVRAAAVNSHPAFIAMLADLVEEALADASVVK